MKLKQIFYFLKIPFTTARVSSFKTAEIVMKSTPKTAADTENEQSSLILAFEKRELKNAKTGDLKKNKGRTETTEIIDILAK